MSAARSLPGVSAPYRTTGQPVRRYSYDVDDPRAQVFRPIGDGTVAGACDFIDRLVRGLGLYADERRVHGKRHDLSANLVRMLERMLRRCTDFATGRCEPSIDHIMKITRFSRATVVAQLRKGRELGLIQWARRTEQTGNRPGEGPTVKQATNAYFFEISKMPAELRRYLHQKLAPERRVEHTERRSSPLVPPRWANGFVRFLNRRRSQRSKTPEEIAVENMLVATPVEAWPALVASLSKQQMLALGASILPEDRMATVRRVATEQQLEFGKSLFGEEWGQTELFGQGASLDTAPQYPP